MTKLPATNAAVPWPTYGADNARLRAVTAPGLRPPFRRLWTFHGRALLEFPPVVGYGSVFEEAFDGRLYSIDPATGRTRWRYDSHRCGWSSPALAGHLLFATFIGNHECKATLPNGALVALSPGTGRIAWQRALGPSESSPLVENGTVYVADQNGFVDAFAARTGRLLWRYDTGAPIKASPTLAYGRIYIGDYAGEMFALAARTGRLIWRSSGHGNFYSTASVDAGRVYVGSLDGRVYAFSARNGDVLWSFGTGSYVYASPAVWRGLVLVGSYDHVFYALDGGTGSLRLELSCPRCDLRRSLGRRRHRLLLELRPSDLRAPRRERPAPRGVARRRVLARGGRRRTPLSRRPRPDLRARARQAGAVTRSASGSSNVNIAPLPGSESTQILPFIERTSSRQM